MLQNLTAIKPASDVLLLQGQMPRAAGGVSQRELERRAEQEMVVHATGRALPIEHEKSGKPLLAGYNVSISHTRGLAAMMVSRGRRVGVDVEYVSPRVSRVASRFLRPDEQAPTVELQLLHWCAKEAVFKLFSERDLTYQQMQILRIADENIIVRVVGGDEVVCRYKFLNGFCIVYVWL